MLVSTVGKTGGVIPLCTCPPKLGAEEDPPIEMFPDMPRLPEALVSEKSPEIETLPLIVNGVAEALAESTLPCAAVLAPCTEALPLTVIGPWAAIP